MLSERACLTAEISVFQTSVRPLLLEVLLQGNFITPGLVDRSV